MSVNMYIRGPWIGCVVPGVSPECINRTLSVMAVQYNIQVSLHRFLPSQNYRQVMSCSVKNPQPRHCSKRFTPPRMLLGNIHPMAASTKNGERRAIYLESDNRGRVSYPPPPISRVCGRETRLAPRRVEDTANFRANMVI
jgi:hypothetical protein